MEIGESIEDDIYTHLEAKIRAPISNHVWHISTKHQFNLAMTLKDTIIRSMREINNMEYVYRENPIGN